MPCVRCPQPLQSLQMQELPREVHKKGDHLGGFDARPMLAPALAGHDVGLVSEAGMPAIADPGASVVRAAHALGHDRGAAGRPGFAAADAGRQRPERPELRLCRLPAAGSAGTQPTGSGHSSPWPSSSGQTQLFIETPYRNAAMLQTLLQTLAAVDPAGHRQRPDPAIGTRAVPGSRRVAPDAALRRTTPRRRCLPSAADSDRAVAAAGQAADARRSAQCRQQRAPRAPRHRRSTRRSAWPGARRGSRAGCSRRCPRP